MRVRFLADANLDQDIVAGVPRRDPTVDFELPQGVIPERMADPDVLGVAASLGRVLVTHDVRTMPQHFGKFIAKRNSSGLILIPRSIPIGHARGHAQNHKTSSYSWAKTQREAMPVSHSEVCDFKGILASQTGSAPAAGMRLLTTRLEGEPEPIGCKRLIRSGSWLRG